MTSIRLPVAHASCASCSSAPSATRTCSSTCERRGCSSLVYQWRSALRSGPSSVLSACWSARGASLCGGPVAGVAVSTTGRRLPIAPRYSTSHSSQQKARRSGVRARPHSQQAAGTGSSLTPARCLNTDTADIRRLCAALIKPGGGGASNGITGADASRAREGDAAGGASAARIWATLDARSKLRARHSAIGSHAFLHRAAVCARWEVRGCDRRTSPSGRSWKSRLAKTDDRR